MIGGVSEAKRLLGREALSFVVVVDGGGSWAVTAAGTTTAKKPANKIRVFSTLRTKAESTFPSGVCASPLSPRGRWTERRRRSRQRFRRWRGSSRHQDCGADVELDSELSSQVSCRPDQRHRCWNGFGRYDDQ